MFKLLNIKENVIAGVLVDRDASLQEENLHGQISHDLFGQESVG